MNTHICIKPGCGQKYQDTDPDAYYCPSCVQQKKAIAQELDAKHVPQPKAPSELELFDMKARTAKTPDGRTVSFARAQDIL